MKTTDDTVLPLPELDELTRPFWDGLSTGVLSFQRCSHCGRAWLPARSECPGCLGNVWQREAASGNGRLVSWVVYRHAYHPAFATRLPYVVAVVELDEGPRLITNVVGVEDFSTLRIDMRLALHLETEAGMTVPRFRLAEESSASRRVV
ncbi:MAG: Zn-ribbon domain-containing OB-fold protein [Rubrivivax sp.]|jgi:uncharacterized OB-fold protein